MSDHTYNGWPNRATWLVNLHLSNDYGLYRETIDLVASHVPAATLDARRTWRDIGADIDDVGLPIIVVGRVAEAVAEYVRDLAVPDAADTSNDPSLMLARDLIGQALADVDWRRIVDAFWPPEHGHDGNVWATSCDYCYAVVDARTCQLDDDGDPHCGECELDDDGADGRDY